MGRTLDPLDAEWQRLIRAQDATGILSAWAAEQPAFAAIDDFERLIDHCRDPRTAGPVLRALVELAAGDWLAARTVLQALIPGLRCVARRWADDDPSAIEELVSLAWERIRTYPLCRRGSVAANILFDVRKRYRYHRNIEAPRSQCLIDGLVADPGSTPEEAVLRTEIRDEFEAARADGLIDGDLADLIVRTRLNGEPLQEVAVDSGITRHAATQRRLRAERCLRVRLAPLR